MSRSPVNPITSAPIRRRAVRRRGRIIALTAAATAIAAVASGVAAADSVGPITFSPPQYALGSINGQQGWMKTGPYDANVVSMAGIPAAAHDGFGAQALQISDAITSGSFGDQTLSPGLAQPAGEANGVRYFHASFSIAAPSRTQTGTGTPAPDGTCPTCLHLSVSPDNGSGARMSYLRFEDQPNGIHVFFDDVTDPGPIGTVANFNETDIATLSRTRAHQVSFSLTLKPGPGNDVVDIALDGHHKITGTTWENYYRYDPEQASLGNLVPTVDKLLFRVSGSANPGDAGHGFLVDNVLLSSSRHETGGHGHGNRAHRSHRYSHIHHGRDGR